MSSARWTRVSSPLQCPPALTEFYEHFFFLYVCTLVAEEVNDPLVICRVYACIADTLAFMAKEGGIRAGPAANKAWRNAFALLEVL